MYSKRQVCGKKYRNYTYVVCSSAKYFCTQKMVKIENQQIATLQVMDIYKVTGITLIQLSST